MYICSYVTQQGSSVCNYVTQQGPSISLLAALPSPQLCYVMLQFPRCPCRSPKHQQPIPNSTGYTEAAVTTAPSVVIATSSGMQCQHVAPRALMPLTKLCASMAPRKYTCNLTPTCRGSDLFPGSSHRSYRQGAIIVSSSSGPRLDLLSSGQDLRRNIS
jgi:hypothetical protein